MYEHRSLFPDFLIIFRSSESATLSKFVAMATALELPEDGEKAVKEKQKSSGRLDEQPSSREASRSSSRQDSRESSRPSSRASSRQSCRSSSPDITNLDSHYENRPYESAFKPIREAFTARNSNSQMASTVPDNSDSRTHSDNVCIEPSTVHSNELLQTDPFRRLSRQPREFNPSPERLRPKTQRNSKSTEQTSPNRSSVLANVTVRPKVIEPPAERSTHQNKYVGESLRTRQESNFSKYDDLENKVPLGNRITYRSGDGVTNVTHRVHQDLKYMHQTSKPKLARPIPEPVSCSVGQGQRSRTNISSVSLATEYNDLPDSLDVENQCPQDYVNSATVQSNSRQKESLRESNTNTYRYERNDLLCHSYKDQNLSTTSRTTEPVKRTTNKGEIATSQIVRERSNNTVASSGVYDTSKESQGHHGKFTLSSSTRRNVTHTSNEQSRLQGSRSSVSKHSASIPGASKQYGISRNQDSGFDSPHIDQ